MLVFCLIYLSFIYNIAEPQMAMGFPLHQYSINGNVEGVRTCANSGVSVNDKDDESWTPLHYACWYVWYTVYKVILEFKKDFIMS